jgi:hypothetical protein
MMGSTPDIRHHPQTSFISFLLMGTAMSVGGHNVLEKCCTITSLGKLITQSQELGICKASWDRITWGVQQVLSSWQNPRISIQAH